MSRVGRVTVAFNGGPDNCPAGARTTAVVNVADTSPFNGGPDNCPAGADSNLSSRVFTHSPSMEGRTIVRPERKTDALAPPEPVAFNGGPDNCPAGDGHRR